MLCILIRKAGFLMLIMGGWLVGELHARELYARETLPNSSDVDAQRPKITQSLEDASRLSATQHFLQDIARSQHALNRLGAEPGSDYFNIPASSERANLQSLWQQAQSPTHQGVMRGIHVPVVFVSFSMPETRLKELLAEADRIGAVVVLRGLINDDLNTTLTRLNEIGASQEAGGLVLDPTLFARFKVESVPTFLLPLEPIPPCDVETCKVPRHIMASGNASLFYFLDLIKRTGDAGERNVAVDWLAKFGDAQ